MSLTRRDLLSAAVEIGALAAVSRVLPSTLFAQAGSTAAAGQEKLIVRSVRPPDYEAPVALLDSWITPFESFYVRSHLPPPPPADASGWALQIDGEVSAPLSMSVADLRRLPPVTMTATLECAGNGRSFYQPAVAGVQWGRGAVGTARWTGVRMADVLKRAGIRSSGRFVVMDGADRPPGTMPDFVRQVPIGKAMDPDTLIAYEMNGAPIPQLHGFPLR